VSWRPIFDVVGVVVSFTGSFQANAGGMFGKSVKSRRCPATVSGDFPVARSHCSEKEWEGATD
jgi:hypothetical protein